MFETKHELCPGCGYAGEWHYQTGEGYAIECSRCDWRGPFGETQGAAWILWNRRVPVSTHEMEPEKTT